MWKCFKLSTTFLLQYPEHLIQTKRTTFILRRKFTPKLNRMNAMTPRKLKRRDFYYELEEYTGNKKKPPVELVLTKDVAGIGMRGDKIEMNMYMAYRDLLLPKLAVYANSLEAKIITTREEKQHSSIYSKIVENFLASQVIEIILNSDIPWNLEQWHVKLALRKNGILTNEDCINIPKEISGPNFDIENKDFLIYLTMNKSETFPIRCRIHFWSSLNPLLNQKSFNTHSPSEPLFPDEKETIDSLIKVADEIKASEMIKRRFQVQIERPKEGVQVEATCH